METPSKICCPEKMIAVILLLHNGTMAMVMKRGDSSKAFLVTSSTKQGFIMASALSLSLQPHSCSHSSTLTETHTSGLDRGLFNLHQFREHTVVIKQLFRELLIADESALIAHMFKDIQFIMDQFACASKCFGFTIRQKKTSLHLTTTLTHTMIPLSQMTNHLSTRSGNSAAWVAHSPVMPCWMRR